MGSKFYIFITILLVFIIILLYVTKNIPYNPPLDYSTIVKKVGVERINNEEFSYCEDMKTKRVFFCN